jgi:hypothetical protein
VLGKKWSSLCGFAFESHVFIAIVPESMINVVPLSGYRELASLKRNIMA